MGDFFMNKDIEFLDYIFKNAQMGVVGIENILDRIENVNLEKLINEQKEAYEDILKAAKEIYKKYGKDEKEITKMAKISSNITANMKLLQKNKDNDHIIAKMMIDGNNKGIIAITEKLNSFKNCDSEIQSLAEKLLKTEQHNLDELKKYL